MLSLVLLSYFRLALALRLSAFPSGLDSHSRVPGYLLLLLTDPRWLSGTRITDSLVGLSCIAIAATLGTFLLNASQKIPFRTFLVALTACTTLGGLAALLSASVPSTFHPALIASLSILVALPSIVTACVMPFVLPYLLSSSSEISIPTTAGLQSESGFRAAADTTSDAFYLLEAIRSSDGAIEDFRFTYLNPSAEKIIPQSSSEVIGSSLSTILPIDPSSALFQKLRQVVYTGRPLIHEFPLVHHDPSGPWMRHQVIRVEDGLAVTASDITELKHAQLNLSPDSNHDALTGLPNRRLLDDRIGQALAHADRFHSKVAVYLINLDSFHEVNQRYGRAAGDQILCDSAARLRAAIRATDSVIRLDADEFILVMPDITSEFDVRRTAGTLIGILRDPHTIQPQAKVDTDAPSPHSITFRISASAGITIYPNTALTSKDLLTGADFAMCRAKLRGKNQYILYNPEVDGPIVREFDSTQDLLRA